MIFHHAAGDWAKRATCGALLSRVHYEESVDRVTCKSCLGLIRSESASPVERRATVAEGETGLPTEIYLRLGLDHRCGQDYVRIWDSSLEPKDGLTRFVSARDLLAKGGGK